MGAQARYMVMFGGNSNANDDAPGGYAGRHVDIVG
jgi:hypothetical protein